MTVQAEWCWEAAGVIFVATLAERVAVKQSVFRHRLQPSSISCLYNLYCLCNLSRLYCPDVVLYSQLMRKLDVPWMMFIAIFKLKQTHFMEILLLFLMEKRDIIYSAKIYFFKSFEMFNRDYFHPQYINSPKR